MIDKFIKRLFSFILVIFMLTPFMLNGAVSADAVIQYTEYIVQQGDTLWLISQKLNINLDELMALNPTVDPLNVYPGLVIYIPSTATTATSAPETTTGSPGTGTGNNPVVSTGMESLTYLYAGTSASYLKILNNTSGSIKTVCNDYFDINPDGSLLITPSNKIDASFIDEMHSRGISVTPFISNHWDRFKGNAALDNRENLSTQVADMIALYNMDGINVDIENVNEQYRNVYSDFVRLLREKIPANKIVSVATAANPKGWTVGWHGSYDYKALSDYSDYLMIMTYDESYQGGPAGPISSKAFFEGSIQYAINQGVPKSKIVAGLPFFGRYWKEGDASGGLAVTAGDIEYMLENYDSSVRYDKETESANVTVTILPDDPKPLVWGGRVLTAGKYDIWYDSLESVKYKLDTIYNFGIKGAGSWALGQESIQTWSFYSDALNGVNVNMPVTTEPTEPTTTAIKTTAAPTTTEPTTVATTTTEPTTPTPTTTATPIIPPTSAPPATQPTVNNPETENITEQQVPQESAPIVSSKISLEKIADALNNSGNSRTVKSSTVLTRGETAVLIAKLYGISPEPANSESFPDTDNYWGAGYINALKRRGILRGIDGKYAPNESVTKEEAAAIFDRILVLPNTINFHEMSFRDITPDMWSYSSIAKLHYFDLITGQNKNFYRPYDTMDVKSIAEILDVIAKKEYPVNPDKYLPPITARSYRLPKANITEPIISPR
ncbi:MAG: glycosyl hydrolase family 18 protein [Oscillospiraceae bacterium]|nr:glycosyl hydrolase family 18 protein [Oscillospiraceae bacterium]